MTGQVPFTLSNIDHLVIRANDVACLLAFYTEVLGCTLERTVESMQLYQLRAGSSLIDLVAVDGPLGAAGGAAPGDGGANLDHFCLRIEPFDAAQLHAWLDAAGVEHSDPGRRYGADGYGQSIYLADPEGNQVELKGAPEL